MLSANQASLPIPGLPPVLACLPQSFPLAQPGKAGESASSDLVLDVPSHWEKSDLVTYRCDWGRVWCRDVWQKAILPPPDPNIDS